MATVTIGVTQEDIDLADAISTCPIDLAVERKVGGACCHMGREHLSLSKASKILIIDVPEIATQFAKHFDCHKEVKPFLFTLEIPDEVLA